MRRNLARVFIVLSALSICAAGSLAEAQIKRLAPGVLNIIPADPDARDSYSMPLQLPGLSANKYQANFAPESDTLYGQTQNIVFFRNVWQYEFAFLGLRQLRVADADEKNSQNIWYMIYRVRNTGKNLSYEMVKEDPRFEHLKADLKRDSADLNIDSKFVPRFTLEGWVKLPDSDYQKVSYRDQVSPSILRRIQQIEDPNMRLLDSVEMMEAKLPITQSESGGGVWGVAIWENVDPNIDYVSVLVSGITNAYRITRDGAGNIGFRYKTLQLNFWRPGDIVRQDTDIIRYGIPLVDNPADQIEICKRYDLPGPLIRGYFVSEQANQNIPVLEVDAQTSLEDFSSPLTPVLDGGKLPETVQKSFADAGITIPADSRINTLIPGKKWTIDFSVDGQPRQYLLQMEPQYWEPYFQGIRFIKSLDYLWTYR